MTGKGRCNDNANIERLWRSFKYEGSYLYKWQTVQELKTNIPKWLYWYNYERPHQSLKYKTPMEKYREFMDKSCDLPTISQYQLQNHDLNFVVHPSKLPVNFEHAKLLIAWMYFLAEY